MNQKRKDSSQSQKCINSKSLTALNIKWQEASSELLTRIKLLEMLIAKWTEFNHVSNTFNENLQKHKNIIIHIENNLYKQKEDAINESLNQLKIIEKSIEERKIELAEITKIGQTIQEIHQYNFINAHISHTVESNEKHLSEICSDVMKIKIILEEKQHKWEQYHQYLEFINNFQKKMDYTLACCKSPIFHPKICSTHIEELISAISTINENQSTLQEFETITKAIIEDVDLTIQLELNAILEDTQKRWNLLIESCDTLLQQYIQLQEKLESLVLQNEIFETSIENSKKQILQLKNYPHSVETYQNLEQKLNVKQIEITDLEQLEKDLSKIEISGQSPFRINFSNNNNKLLKDCKIALQCCMNNSKYASKEMNDHQVQIDQVSKFLDTGEEKLTDEWSNFNEENIEEVINDLKAYMDEIPWHEVSIFTLNEKVTQNIFNSEKCQEVLTLLLRWKRFHVNLVEKYISIKNQWIQKQNFVGKCRMLLLFLHELRYQLTTEVPSGYENVVREYCKMQVLDIITSGQQGVLLSFMQEGLEISARMEEETAEKFLEQLYKLHEQWLTINDMLTKKKNTLLHILSLWQNYMKILQKIQSWLNDTELQSLNFKKNCLCTIEEMRKEIAFINNILDQKIFWENTLQELHSMYLALIPYMKSESIEIIHKEKCELRKRMDELYELFSAQKTMLLNLEEDWNQFYNKLNEFKQLLEPIENLAKEKIPSSYTDLVYQLEQHKIYKKKLQEFDSYIEELDDVCKSLSEKFSSSEILQIKNNIVTFRENIKTIYYKLINRINVIEKSLQEWPRFHKKCAYFLEWILNMEKEINQRGDHCLEDACQKLEKTYHLEIQNKTEEYDKITKFGERLIMAGDDREFSVQEDLEEIQMAWKKLILLRIRRLDKLTGLFEESKQLQQKMFEFNEWLEGKEHILFAPVIYENFEYAEITRQIENMEEHEEEIENQYRILRSIMSLCEMLIHDNDAIVNPVERDAIQRSIESYKRRWKELGTIPAEHKSQIEETWNQWKKIMIDLDEVELLLSDYEKQTKMPKSCATIYTRDEICEELKRYELLQQSIQPLFELLETINNQFEELEEEGCIDKANMLRNRVDWANSHCSELVKRIDIIICRLSYTLQLWEEFQALNEQLLMWLTELDLLLTQTEYFPEKQESLKKHLEEIEEHREQKECLFQLSVYLQQRSEQSDSVRADEIMQKTHDYWDELFARHLQLQQSMKEKKETDDTDGNLPKELIENKMSKEENIENEIPIPIILTEPSETSVQYLDDTMTLESGLNQENGNKQNSILDELRVALKETEEKLGVTEEALRSETPIGFETELASHNYSRLLAACRYSVDVLKHFNNLLECEEEGLSQVTTHHNHAQGIISRWEILEAKTIEKDRRFQQACHQWQQYMDDLDSMESWLESSEEKQLEWTSVLKDMSKLEIMIQNHREFLMEMIKHKPTVLSLNMLTQKFVSSKMDEIRSEELQARMKILNKRWEILCQSATVWQNELQKALLQCPDFQNTLQELISWLEMSEEKIHQMGTLENVVDHDIISIQYNKYLELKQELERCKPKVKAFERTANNLMIPSAMASSLGKEVETAEIQKQLNNVNNCLQALINKCDAEIHRLNRFVQPEDDENAANNHFTGSKETAKDNKIARENELERSKLNRCYRYLSRVARASLPIQGLLLLLLGIASLVPMSEDDFSCVLTNNFARSFDPMLKYPDGPPPI